MDGMFSSTSILIINSRTLKLDITVDENYWYQDNIACKYYVEYKCYHDYFWSSECVKKVKTVLTGITYLSSK